ncbi:alanine racemase [Rhizobium sp. KVB221]|uniref:Alanine racemase n=1 Tax=Rhizobium setariae TaxID=2801340 RepID=A0A937CPS0_9HYPH|nr:alanine racemase [Rhizobium setariae]MBL0375246.1 alanine racemase [Rhizobium setariae]
MDNSLNFELDNDALSGRLVIDLQALKTNYVKLAGLVGVAEAGAVVKADAYGLGAARIAPALYEAGCRKFFVAHLQEAASLKRYLPKDARLYILNGLLPSGEKFAAANGFVPVLNSLEQIANWAATARALARELPAVLQFDTGMSRLGLSGEEIATLLDDPSLLDGIDMQFVMSHLASADEGGSQQNVDQLAVMKASAQLFPDVSLCFANSGGIFLGGTYHGALVRPGIALYGGIPTDAATTRMQQVVRLDARVIQTRTVPAGTLVGYSGAHLTSRETRLATIAAGYADGLPRSLSDRGAAYFGETRLPIVGRVSMDSITLDVSALPSGTLKLGSLVELIGPHQTLEDIAAAAGTISYEILTSLGHRYHREYV